MLGGSCGSQGGLFFRVCQVQVSSQYFVPFSRQSSAMSATERINVRVQILGCRVWVRPRLANDPHFAAHWARIRVCQNSWTPAAWALRVRSELRAKWGGGTHGGVGRGGGAHGGIRRTNKQRAGARKPAQRVRTESVSGDHTGCRQHADVSKPVMWRLALWKYQAFRSLASMCRFRGQGHERGSRRRLDERMQVGHSMLW